MNQRECPGGTNEVTLQLTAVGPSIVDFQVSVQLVAGLDQPYILIQFKSSSYLCCVDKLISQALSNGLDVSEGSLSGTSAQQPDSLWKSSKIYTFNNQNFHDKCNAVNAQFKIVDE